MLEMNILNTKAGGELMYMYVNTFAHINFLIFAKVDDETS